MKDESLSREGSAARSEGAGRMTPASPGVEEAAADGLRRFWTGIGRFLSHLVAAFVRRRPGMSAPEPVCLDNSRSARNRDAEDLRRKLDLAEAELAAKTRLIALTSHELRTPLNGILGMADLLARTPLSPEQSSYVQAVNTSATALLSLVDDMLDAGKIAAGRWPLKLQPVGIEGLVEEVVELLAPRAQAKGLELAAHVTMQVPETVSADPDQIIRILMNLIGNAIKFTERGGVAVDVSVERETAVAVTLALRVRDSGVGIPIKDQARIFGEYEQADGAATDRRTGTGLGLAISRGIARAMGGDITLESSPGEGSVFCFRVDLQILDLSPSVGRPFNDRHILLISDRLIEPPVLMRRLFDLGASVELARTPDAARSGLASRRQVDAILFDHSGSLDSVAFKATIAAPHPQIAVMIAPADRQALDRIRESGIRAHLIKPMRTGSLTKVLATLFSGEALAVPAVHPPSAQEPSGQREAGASAELKILLADDNDINILLGQSMLRSLGQTSEVASNGALAVARAAEAVRFGHPYDVILMDLHMPKLDGFAAIAAIRDAEQNQGRRSLIIALTADSTEQSAVRAIGAGADLAMTKPIQRQVLIDVLERARSASLARHTRIPRYKRPPQRRKPMS